ncbi:MAG: response regulator [Pseudomonadota bacterium]|nr:response regulator [Pseudomonadota bacterium]
MTVKVLLVDDSRVSRMGLKKAIKGVSQEFEISEAENADVAEAYLQDNTADIALIDFNMPGRNGLELVEAIIGQHPDMKYVLVTANIQTSIQEKAKGLGVEFVDKPVNASQLAEVIGGFCD